MKYEVITTGENGMKFHDFYIAKDKAEALSAHYKEMKHIGYKLEWIKKLDVQQVKEGKR